MCWRSETDGESGGGTPSVIMDDPTRTRKTLDDLADLFLSDAAGSPQPGSPGNKRDNGLSTGESTPQQGTDPFIGPDPFPFAPRRSRGWVRSHALVANPSASPIAATPLDPTNQPVPPGERATENTDKWFDGPQADGAAQREPVSKRVEAVFLGNLPGLSGPWLTQYAYALATQRGPVAVLTVDDGEVDVELVAADECALDALEASVRGQRRTQSLRAVLDNLAGSAQDGVNTWLVQFPTPIGLPTQVMARDLQRWTLLCGADDAAIVGTYRLLKQLLGLSQVTPSTNNSGPGPRRVDVMIMGSEETVGKAAAAKLNMAAGSFLKTPVRLAGSQARMRPVKTRLLGPCVTEGGDSWPQIISFLHEVVGGGEPIDPNRAGPALEEAHQQGILASLGPRHGEPTVRGDRRMPSRAMDGSDSDPKSDTGGEPQPGVSQSPFSEFVAFEDPDLCAMLGCPAVPLQARCPHHSHVQLAVDTQGQLHLLASITSGVSQGDAVSMPDRDGLALVVLQMMEVSRWACEHSSVLQMVQTQHRLNQVVQPVLHLFTDRAKAAVELVAALGSLAKIHLLQKVHVGTSSTWFSTELN